MMSKYCPHRKKYELVFQSLSTVPQLDIKSKSLIRHPCIATLLHEAVFHEWFSTRGAYVPCVYIRWVPEGCLEYVGVSWAKLKLIVFFRSRTKGQNELMHILRYYPSHRLLLLIPKPNTSQSHPSYYHNRSRFGDGLPAAYTAQKVKPRWRI